VAVGPTSTLAIHSLHRARGDCGRQVVDHPLAPKVLMANTGFVKGLAIASWPPYAYSNRTEVRKEIVP